MERDVKTEIREEWFKDHKAEYEKIGDIAILRWGMPGSNIYRVRYVFDYNKIYITGDIGDAIFKIYDEITLEKACELDIHYFHKKLITIGEDKWSFNSELAIKYLDEKIEEITQDKYEYLGLDEDGAGVRESLSEKEERKIEEYDNYITTMNNLKETADRCTLREHWVTQIYLDHIDELEEYDQEYYEWIFNIGNEIPNSVQAFLIGLKMANEQLKTQSVVA